MSEKIVLGPGAQVKLIAIDPATDQLIYGASGCKTGTRIVRLERMIPGDALWQVLGRVGPGEHYRLSIVEDSSLLMGERESMKYVMGVLMSDEEYLRRKMKGVVVRAMFFSALLGALIAYAFLYCAGALK